MKRPLVLASTSTYRRELLGRLGIPFATAVPRFDEGKHRQRFAQLSEEAYALEMASGKARSLAEDYDDHWILAADQIAVLPGPPRRLLIKPDSEAAAVAQLLDLAGRTHHLTTAVVLYDSKTQYLRTAVDRQKLTMRDFSGDEAAAYVARCRPLDSVGAYRIEDAGITLVESIEGKDYTGIIGLPLLEICRLFREVNLL